MLANHLNYNPEYKPKESQSLDEDEQIDIFVSTNTSYGY